MLDRLLGRAELRTRIEELEEEKRHLERRLEAESERRSDAVSARQGAERRVNRLEDRIAELEGRVERLGSDGDGADVEFRGVEDLRGERLTEVLRRLRSVETGPEGALTALVEDGAVPEAVADAFGDAAPLLRRAAPCLALTDDAGLVRVALSPPLPPDPFAAWDEGFRIEESWFGPTGRTVVALARSDRFAVGEYDGDLSAVETVESDVMNAHSKGGFSQGRFERRRDEQIDAHVEKSRALLEERLSTGVEGGERTATTVAVLGERTVLGEFSDLADLTAAVDASGDPDEALAEAVQTFWTARLYRV